MPYDRIARSFVVVPCHKLNRGDPQMWVRMPAHPYAARWTIASVDIHFRAYPVVDAEVGAMPRRSMNVNVSLRGSAMIWLPRA
jgi:hypothetical protein